MPLPVDIRIFDVNSSTCVWGEWITDPYMHRDSHKDAQTDVQARTEFRWGSNLLGDDVMIKFSSYHIIKKGEKVIYYKKKN